MDELRTSKPRSQRKRMRVAAPSSTAAKLHQRFIWMVVGVSNSACKLKLAGAGTAKERGKKMYV